MHVMQRCNSLAHAYVTLKKSLWGRFILWTVSVSFHDFFWFSIFFMRNPENGFCIFLISGRNWKSERADQSQIRWEEKWGEASSIDPKAASLLHAVTICKLRSQKQQKLQFLTTPSLKSGNQSRLSSFSIGIGGTWLQSIFLNNNLDCKRWRAVIAQWVAARIASMRLSSGLGIVDWVNSQESEWSLIMLWVSSDQTSYRAPDVLTQ